MRGVLKLIRYDKKVRKAVKEEVTKLPEDSVNALGKVKMKELRGLGGPFGAKDTSKDELIEEILESVPSDIIKTFLEER